MQLCPAYRYYSHYTRVSWLTGYFNQRKGLNAVKDPGGWSFPAARGWCRGAEVGRTCAAMSSWGWAGHGRGTGVPGWQGTGFSPALLVTAAVSWVESVVRREKSNRQVNRKLFRNPPVSKASPARLSLCHGHCLSQSLPRDGVSPLAPGLPGVARDLLCPC